VGASDHRLIVGSIVSRRKGGKAGLRPQSGSAGIRRGVEAEELKWRRQELADWLTDGR